MGISITVDVSGKINQLSPQINKAIRSALKTSLSTIKDKWQSDVQRVIKSNTPIYLSGSNPIKYPLDDKGFVGEIVLPDISQQSFMALNLRSTLLPPFSMGSMTQYLTQYKTIPLTTNRLKFSHSVHTKTQNYRNVDNQKTYAGLKRIVYGYSKKGKKVEDPLKVLSRKAKLTMVSAERLMPFAKSTFIDMINTNLNGIT